MFGVHHFSDSEALGLFSSSSMFFVHPCKTPSHPKNNTSGSRVPPSFCPRFGGLFPLSRAKILHALNPTPSKAVDYSPASPWWPPPPKSFRIFFLPNFPPRKTSPVEIPPFLLSPPSSPRPPTTRLFPRDPRFKKYRHDIFLTVAHQAAPTISIPRKNELA